jgi:hypothetical protein
LIKQEPVDLKLQTILSIIPYVQLYPFYRIQKLRRYFLIVIGILFGVSSVMIAIIFVMAALYDPKTNASTYLNLIKLLMSTPMMAAGVLCESLMNIYFVRKWSNKWNKQFYDNAKQINSQEKDAI